MAKRSYYQEYLDLRKDIVTELKKLLKNDDEVNLTEKYIFAIGNDGGKFNFIKICKVKKNKKGKLSFECKDMSGASGESIYYADQIDTKGLADLLDNIFVDDCEPE
jgi:hypothetical protein